MTSARLFSDARLFINIVTASRLAVITRMVSRIEVTPMMAVITPSSDRPESARPRQVKAATRTVVRGSASCQRSTGAFEVRLLAPETGQRAARAIMR